MINPMTDPADLRLFQALSAACHASDQTDDALRQTIDQAIATGAPTDMQAARRALDRLDPALSTALLRQAHLHMARDLSAIWEALPGARSGRRPV